MRSKIARFIAILLIAILVLFSGIQWSKAHTRYKPTECYFTTIQETVYCYFPSQLALVQTG